MWRASIIERGDLFFIKFVISMQEFILELAAGDLRVANFNEEAVEKGIGQIRQDCAQDKFGGYLWWDTFRVGPWSRIVKPPRLRRPRPGYTSSNMGWTRSKPASPLQVSRKERTQRRLESQYNPEYQLGR